MIKHTLKISQQTTSVCVIVLLTFAIFFSRNSNKKNAADFFEKLYLVFIYNLLQNIFGIY